MYWRSNRKSGSPSQKKFFAIFLLPVWPLQPPGRSFLSFSVPYGGRIADRRLENLPMRKLGATYLNLWTGSRNQKPEVLSKMPEIVRNVVKCNVIRKMRDRNVADKPEVVVYFGLLLILTR